MYERTWKETPRSVFTNHEKLRKKKREGTRPRQSRIYYIFLDFPQENNISVQRNVDLNEQIQGEHMKRGSLVYLQR